MWSEVGERAFFSPVSIVEAEENVKKVRENLKIAQSRQKSYADPKREMSRLKLVIMSSSRYHHFEGQKDSTSKES